MIITVGAMIGAGKSSLAKLIGEHFGTQVFYESVEGNPILPLFYTASEEEIQSKRYPFLLQLYFLDTRFKAIKEALVNDNNVLDRSIYEDWYFAKVNKDLGRISDLEFQMYESLLNNMMEELKELPKKSPDLMVYLSGSFETILERINKRGRGYELAPELVDYYRTLWEGYDAWVNEHYKASEIIVIDIDKYDYVNNEEDAKEVLQMIEDKLKEVRKDVPVLELSIKAESEKISELDEKELMEILEEADVPARLKEMEEEVKRDMEEETGLNITEVKIKLNI